MPELAAILERAGRTADLEPGHYERLLRRRDRRRRNRRIGSALLAIVIAVVTIGYAVSVLRDRPERIPMDRITSQNVGQLGLAWTASAPVATGTGGSPSIRDGIVYADVGTGEGMAGIQGFPVACSASDGSCLPTWSADAPHDLAGIVVDERYLFVGEGINHPAASAVTQYRLDAFARSCRSPRCRPVWTSPTVHTSLEPIDVIGDRLYVRVGDTLEAYARSCPHPVCDPVWTGRDVGPPAIVGDRAVVRTPSGAMVFPSACWSAQGPACTPIWTADIDLKVDPTTLPPPVVAGGHLLLDDVTAVRAFPIDCRGSCPAEWRAPVPGGPGFEPVIANGMMFTAASAGSDVYAFPLDCRPSREGSCASAWIGHTDEGVGYSPLVTGDHVVVASVLGSTLVAFPTLCVDACVPAWTAELDDSIATAPTASDDVVLVSGLASVSAFASGCTDPCGAIFRWDLPGGNTQMSPLVNGDALVVVGGDAMYELRLGSQASTAQASRSGTWQAGPALLIGASILVLIGLVARRRRRAFP